VLKTRATRDTVVSLKKRKASNKTYSYSGVDSAKHRLAFAAQHLFRSACPAVVNVDLSCSYMMLI